MNAGDQLGRVPCLRYAFKSRSNRFLFSSSIHQDSSSHYTKGTPSTTESNDSQSLVGTTCPVSHVPSRYSSLSLSLTCRFIEDGTPVFKPAYTALVLLMNLARFRSPLLPNPRLFSAYPTKMFQFGFFNRFSWLVRGAFVEPRRPSPLSPRQGRGTSLLDGLRSSLPPGLAWLSHPLSVSSHGHSLRTFAGMDSRHHAFHPLHPS